MAFDFTAAREKLRSQGIPMRVRDREKALERIRFAHTWITENYDGSPKSEEAIQRFNTLVTDYTNQYGEDARVPVFTQMPLEFS